MAQSNAFTWLAMSHDGTDKDDENSYGFVVRIEGLM
jgi:hypothetical protein